MVRVGTEATLSFIDDDFPMSNKYQEIKMAYQQRVGIQALAEIMWTPSVKLSRANRNDSEPPSSQQTPPND